jgi:hypothetical protein
MQVVMLILQTVSRRNIPSVKGKALSQSVQQTSEYCCRVSRLHYLIDIYVITLFTLQIDNILSLLRRHHQVHTQCDVT